MIVIFWVAQEHGNLAVLTVQTSFNNMPENPASNLYVAMLHCIHITGHLHSQMSEDGADMC